MSGSAVQVPGGHMAFRRSGTGPQTIVWVHGLPLDGRSWVAQEEHFRSRAQNIIVDLRGYGHSSPLPDGADVTAVYAGDLDCLFAELDLHDAIMVGFASAGHVALRFAAVGAARASLARLAVINASPKFRRAPDWPHGFDEAGIRHFTDAHAERGLEGMLDAVLDPALVFRDLPRDRARELAESFREMGRRAGARTLMGFFESISRDDDRALLPLVDVPTLLISSTIGLEVPTEVGLYMRHHLRNARLVEIPGADHFVFATRPTLVNMLLEELASS